MKLYISLILLFGIFSYTTSQQKYASEPDWYKTYDVKFYSLNLEVSDTGTYLKGSTLIKVQLTEPTDTFVFNFNPLLIIDSVFIENKKVNSKFQSDLFIIKNTKTEPVNTNLNIIIYYKGNVNTSSFFSSLSSEKDNFWNIPVTWTLSEPFGAKYWFPCKQQLTDKADSCWVFLTIPKGRKAGSVGVLTDTINIGSNKVQYQWKTSYPIAFYLISYTVSDYSDFSFYTKIDGIKDSLLVQNYIYNRPGYLENNRNEIEKTKDFLKLYSRLFGVYPFIKEKYGHCVAPIGGGMEHQTMTTLNDFSYTLVSHELMHQWFGDNTTCASWQDIWVNEGFASYGEYLAYENLGSKTEADSWMISAQNRALREAEGSVFIPATEAEDEYRIFSTNLSYKKGAVIVHMLRKQINNDSLFFRSLRAYLSKYRYKSATGEDLRNVMEQETGINFHKFFDQWYYGKGYPMFDISWKLSNDTLLLNVNQTPSSRSISFFTTSFDIRATGAGVDTIIRLEQNTNPQLYKIKLSKEVSNLEFDPDKWLLKVVQNITRLPEIPSNDNYFEVKPNPFNGDLYLNFSPESSKDEKIEIINMNGSVLYKTLINKKKEMVIHTVNIGPGTYLLVVSHGKDKYVRKIVKANTY